MADIAAALLEHLYCEELRSRTRALTLFASVELKIPHHSYSPGVAALFAVLLCMQSGSRQLKILP